MSTPFKSKVVAEGGIFWAMQIYQATFSECKRQVPLNLYLYLLVWTGNVIFIYRIIIFTHISAIMSRLPYFLPSVYNQKYDSNHSFVSVLFSESNGFNSNQMKSRSKPVRDSISFGQFHPLHRLVLLPLHKTLTQHFIEDRKSN